MDTLNPAERSERMRRIRSEDTAPEMVVRRLVHRMGYRYRLHARGLPGVPDLVFKRAWENHIGPWVLLALAQGLPPDPGAQVAGGVLEIEVGE